MLKEEIKIINKLIPGFFVTEVLAIFLAGCGQNPAATGSTTCPTTYKPAAATANIIAASARSMD